MRALKHEQLKQQKALENQLKSEARRTACAEKAAKREQLTGKRRLASSSKEAPAHKQRKDGPESQIEGT